jgi:catechol 2,3-dioxygenase-like lactoylglutathione lyase family enzyme
MRNAGVNGFDHTRVYVSDMTAARAFYEGFLGLEVYAENPRQDSPGIAKIFGREGAAVQLVFGRLAGHIVELIKILGVELDRPPKYYVGGSGFTVTVEDIDAAYAAAVENGVEIMSEIVEVKSARIFFVADPDGARVELVQFADNHHVAWPQ